MREQLPLLGQDLLQGPHDFGEGRSPAPRITATSFFTTAALAAGERNQMAIASDVDAGGVLGSLDRPRAHGLKKLRMDGPAEHAEDVLCNGGSYR